MKQNHQVSRRRFLQHTAALAGAAAGAQFIGMPFLRGANSPSTKLRVAVVGAGGMGGYSFDSALKEQLVAICDVDENQFAPVLKKRLTSFPPRCNRYRRFGRTSTRRQRPPSARSRTC